MQEALPKASTTVKETPISQVLLRGPQRHSKLSPPSQAIVRSLDPQPMLESQLHILKQEHSSTPTKNDSGQNLGSKGAPRPTTSVQMFSVQVKALELPYIPDVHLFVGRGFKVLGQGLGTMSRTMEAKQLLKNPRPLPQWTEGLIWGAGYRAHAGDGREPGRLRNVTHSFEIF